MKTEGFKIKLSKSNLTEQEKKRLLWECFSILLSSFNNKKMENLKKHGKENISKQ